MSNRKPYVRTMQKNWWAQHPFYRFYMLREATVLPLIAFCLFLFAGLACLATGEAAWQSWLNFMANPLIVLVNILALLGSLLHASTFFTMMPSVVPIRIKGKLLDKKFIVLTQWALVALISLLALILV